MHYLITYLFYIHRSISDSVAERNLYKLSLKSIQQACLKGLPQLKAYYVKMISGAEFRICPSTKGQLRGSLSLYLYSTHHPPRKGPIPPLNTPRLQPRLSGRGHLWSWANFAQPHRFVRVQLPANLTRQTMAGFTLDRASGLRCFKWC